MTPALTFSLVSPLPLLNQWQRMHWRERKRFQKALSWEIGMIIPRGCRKVPMERCLILVERFSNPPLPDADGLGASVKPLLDCLVMPHEKINPHGLGVIRNDNPRCIGATFTFPRVRNNGDPGTLVSIFHDTQESVDFLLSKVAAHIDYTRTL